MLSRVYCIVVDDAVYMSEVVVAGGGVLVEFLWYLITSVSSCHTGDGKQQEEIFLEVPEHNKRTCMSSTYVSVFCCGVEVPQKIVTWLILPVVICLS